MDWITNEKELDDEPVTSHQLVDKYEDYGWYHAYMVKNYNKRPQRFLLLLDEPLAMDELLSTWTEKQREC